MLFCLLFLDQIALLGRDRGDRVGGDESGVHETDLPPFFMVAAAAFKEAFMAGFRTF